MTKATRVLVISIAALALSIVGLLVMLFLAMAYFGYKGTRLDWIYPTIIALCLSVVGVVASGVAAIVLAIKRRTLRQL